MHSRRSLRRGRSDRPEQRYERDAQVKLRTLPYSPRPPVASRVATRQKNVPGASGRNVATVPSSGIVDAIDVIILTAKVGGSDLTGDLDCDGVVDNNDLSIQDGSLGSACPTVNPTRETSWGRVKTIYR